MTATSERITVLKNRLTELRTERQRNEERLGAIDRDRSEQTARIERAMDVEVLTAAEAALTELDRERRVLENRTPILDEQIRGVEVELGAVRDRHGIRLVSEAMVAADVHLQRILEELEAIEALRQTAVDAGAGEGFLPGLRSAGNGSFSGTVISTLRACDVLAKQIRTEWQEESLPAARAILDGS